MTQTLIEKIVQNNSSPDFIATNTLSDQNTLAAIQKIYDNLDSLVLIMKESTNSQKQIFYYIQSLTDQIKELTSHGREQDKKLSNFLSTQLNTQASMLQLTTQLSQEGVMDKQTKIHLQNIDKGIRQLITKIKK